MRIAYHSFLLQLLLFFFASFAESNDQRKVYLVHMKVGGHRYESSVGHKELLGHVLDHDSTVENAHIYTYNESFTGFSARLTETERQKLMNRREVLDVTRSRDLELHTTRSWDLMNLTLKAKRRPEVESNLVVAVIDSGISPSHELFSSDGLPPPAGWENKCENITCTSKIIGARSYYPDKNDDYIVLEEKSVTDVMGHGTHIASIVAGNIVHDASYFGLAKGTMRGGVPSAKIAVYKTCWRVKYKDKTTNSSVCPQHVVLRAIDDAIKDNVSIISYSQGSNKYIPMHEDCISWAFLRALNKSILTSASAGNSEDYYSVINGAPWIMTVAASLKDTHFATNLSAKIRTIEGNITALNTINTFETQSSYYPLVEKKLSPKATRKRDLLVITKNKDAFMLSNLKNDEGKVVFFNQSEITLLSKEIKEHPEGAIIWGTTNDSLTATPHQYPIASIYLSIIAGKFVHEFSTHFKSEALVKIYKTEDQLPNENWIQTVADLSSRGPNCDDYLANILKPDIAAPGLNIIAGWPEDVKLVDNVKDDRRSKYNIQSGTSMACPHATGLALYLKSFNDTWSPSAIKSALMTTSTKIKAIGDEFAYGSGQLDATKVLNPGLIYETHYQDYIDFMCKQGYNTERLRSHLGNPEINCSGTKIDQDADLNYPSMTARVELKEKFTKVFRRNVTNVGAPSSTYIREINVEPRNENYDVEISVDPQELHFEKVGESKTFTVTVTGTAMPNWKSGETFSTRNTWLTWTEIHGTYQVRSPIIIYSIKKRTNVCQ